MKPTTITIYATPTGYNARWSGPEAANIRRLFGTATIPTAYTARARADDVLAAITRLNPECNVVLA